MSQTLEQPPTAERMANEVIRASAGSGKTYQLSNRYLRLLFSGAAPDSILATTFTRKAAGEILDRILSRLAGAAADDIEAAKLGAALDIESLSRSACLARLEQLTRNLHRLRISTLDALFMKIAGSCSLEMDLPPGWRIVEETVASRLRDRATQQVLSEGKLSDLLTLLNLLTKGEASRSISYLIRETVDNLYSIWLESEEPAWHRIPSFKRLPEEEVAEIIDFLRVAELPQPRIRSSCDKDVAKAEAADWAALLGGGLCGKVLEGNPTMWGIELPADVVAAFERLLSHIRGLLVGQLADQTEASFQLLTRFDGHYQQLQYDYGALRFDDITRLVALGQSAMGARLSLRMGGNIDHMLLDEFQDTSVNQWHALLPLAERTAAADPDRSFFCVGDWKQAIYRWRGGEAGIFDELDSVLPDIAERPLDKSYRSSPVVIDCVNTVFQNVLRHNNLVQYEEPIQQWLKQFPTHETDRTELAGYAVLETSDDIPERPSKTPPQHWKYTARRIKRLAESAPHATIGVLVRKNETVARLIYELRAIGVAASEEGGNPLIDSPAVELILSLLRLADHPGDSRCWFHVASSPLGQALGYGDHDRWELAGELAAKVRAELFAEGYGACVERWASLLGPRTDRRDWSRLEQLIEAAFQYDSEATLRPHEFIELVEAQRVADPTADRVRVMTIHQSKGLQFDCVVLPELQGKLRGQTPSVLTHRPSATEPIDTVMHYAGSEVQLLLPPELREMFDELFTADIHESMCLLYVALTRAVHALHMIVLPQDPDKRSHGLPKSFAGLVRAALTDSQPIPPATLAYESGDPAWMRAPGSPTGDEEDGSETPPPLPQTIDLAASGSAPPRIRESVSPSSLEGDRRVNVAQFFRSGRESILLRGTVIHAWFEQIAWLEDGLPADDDLLQVAAEAGATRDDAARWLGEFHTMVTKSEVVAPLKRAFYKSHPTLGDRVAAGCTAEVFAEQAIYVREEEYVLEGFIDRLVVLFNGGKPVAAEVLDFKTDGIESDKQLQDKVRHYRPQVEAYRRAVSRMWKLPAGSIAGRLIFVERGANVAVGAKEGSRVQLELF